MDFLNAALFWIFSAGLLLSAVLVVVHRSPVASAMSLVLSMVFAAALMIKVGAYFLGTIQILVYAGAVMVLFLFIIMLLDLKEEQRRSINGAAWLASLAVIGTLIMILSKVLGSPELKEASNAPLGMTYASDVHALGALLFSQYLLPFEITSLLLLVAIIGVVMLSKTRESPRKPLEKL